ncbi:hypothetical protein [Brevibacillus borstelensis]|uniref:hypothetical protein n=1 Tax=Brevibacillus borstelensis TaxID=45462 RepID=UPI0030C61F64
MNGDFVADLLGKLSKKTGREWTLTDIMKLAEKLPKNGSGNIESVLSELSGMGLDLSDETKEKVRQQVQDGKSFSPDQIEELTITQKKEKRERKKSSPKASGKVKNVSLAERIKKMQSRKKKRT